MAISVLTNVSSLSAQRNLGITQNRLTSSVEKLSSGLRITRAADDAAGLAISSGMKADLRSMNVATRNAHDAVSLIQTAEGGLSEINGLLTRMRELATQASTAGTLGSSERGYLDQEFDALRNEINRITEVTEFNGQVLVDGSLSAGVGFQVGFQNSANDRFTVTFSTSTATALSVDTTDISTADNAMDALEQIDSAINTLASRRADLGAAQNRLNVTISNLGSMNENITAGVSRIVDVDVAAETAQMTQSNILMQAGASILSQANQMPQIALQLLGG